MGSQNLGAFLLFLLPLLRKSSILVLGDVMLKGLNLTVQDLLAGQDQKVLVMCFFKHSGRVRIRSIRVDGWEYRAGRLVAALFDSETGRRAKERADIPARRPITIKLVNLTESKWAQLTQEVDEEVA